MTVNIANIKLKVILILLSLFVYHSAYAQGIKNNSPINLQDKETYLLNVFEKILQNNNWKTIYQNNTLHAYRFRNSYDKLSITIKTESAQSFYLFTVSIILNGKISSMTFSVKGNRIHNSLSLKQLISPFVIKHAMTDTPNEWDKKAYLLALSIGYNRTHDNRRFYPEWGQGSFYSSLCFLYDPAKHVQEKDIPMGIGDYLSFDLYFAYDSHIRENFFNIDVMIFGENRFKKNKNSTKRTLSGFFNGFEYFRPGFYDSALQWNRQVYKKQPHLQYTIWRALQWGIQNTYKNNQIYKFSFMIGFGPSINSSLTATDVKYWEVKDLSHIFKSKDSPNWIFRMQNYYYSVSLPISGSFTIDKYYNFKFSAGYNLYVFYPIENEVAYDIVNIIKFSAGYYITDECLFDTHYQYWHIKGRVREVIEIHGWHKLILEVKYLF